MRAGGLSIGDFVTCLSKYDKAGNRRDCGWEGQLKECGVEHFCDPPILWEIGQGREGDRYHCPKCGCVVHLEITRT